MDAARSGCGSPSSSEYWPSPRLDSWSYAEHSVRMGVSAAVVGFRQAVTRGSVVAQTDDCLVGRARAGDDAAFEAIYDRYARGVLAFCVHMLGSRESAEDALQLTFISAYRALRGGESNISLRPWLYTIARNRCLSELRTRREGVDVAAVERDVVGGGLDVLPAQDENPDHGGRGHTEACLRSVPLLR